MEKKDWTLGLGAHCLGEYSGRGGHSDIWELREWHRDRMKGRWVCLNVGFSV